MVRFDDSTKRALENLIRNNFPDAHADEGSISGLAAALWMTQSPALDLTKYSSDLKNLVDELGLQVIDGPVERSIHCRAGKEDAGIRYYQANAEHIRKAPVLDPFTGKLAMARVTLPESDPRVFETRLGTVEPADHLLATLAEVRREYGSEVPHPIARVDLISPARLGGTRFGAIGVYLGYREADGTPTFYLLEAGTATGDSKVLYFNEVGDEVINSYAGYRPTPFANPMHAYVGKLTLAGDSPERLQVTSRRMADQKPYIKIDVRFEETTDPDIVWPAFHIMRALGIVLSRIPKVPKG